MGTRAPVPTEQDAPMLAPRPRLILRAALRVILPPEPQIENREERVLRFMEGIVPYFPTLLSKTFPLGLYLLEYGTLIFAFTLTPFSQMDAARARRYFDGWRHSRSASRRQLALGVQQLAMMAFYRLPEVMDALPFPYIKYAEERVAFRKQLHPGDFPPEPEAASEEVPEAEPQPEAQVEEVSA